MPQQLRIARAIFSYPTSEHAGVGLPAYYLSDVLPHPTLHLARRLSGVPRPIGEHVTVRLLSCPNPPVSGKRTPWGLLARAVVKVLGVAAFTAQSIPPLLRFRPDIVHLHTHLPLPLGVVARLLGRRVVITVHGSDLLVVKASRLVRWLYARVAHEIWYVSAAMEPELRALFPRGTLALTPSGVDLDTFRRAARPTRPQLVAVGTLKWQKGYPVLIDAFRRLAGAFPGHRLVIVGEGEDRPALQRAVDDAGLAGRVELVGSRTQEEIVEILGESELFVLASVSEGFPKVLLEAMACALPVVVTDVGSCGEVVRRHRVGEVVPPGDPAALADAIARLLGDPALRRECGDRAEAAAREYAWAGTAAVAEARYRALAGRGAAPALPAERASAPAAGAGRGA